MAIKTERDKILERDCYCCTLCGTSERESRYLYTLPLDPMRRLTCLNGTTVCEKHYQTSMKIGTFGLELAVSHIAEASRKAKSIKDKKMIDFTSEVLNRYEKFKKQINKIE